MGRLGPWLVAIIAFVAVFVDIPKHQFSFPFNCPGVCLKLGDLVINQEIKTHLGLDLQGGTQLVLRMQTAPSSTALAALNREFTDIVTRGELEVISATPEEIADDDHVDLARVAFRFDRHGWARLRMLIDRLNAGPATGDGN